MNLIVVVLTSGFCHSLSPSARSCIWARNVEKNYTLIWILRWALVLAGFLSGICRNSDLFPVEGRDLLAVLHCCLRQI